MLENLVDWLCLATIDDLVKVGLHESLTEVIDKIHDIGGAIHRLVFRFRPEKRDGDAAGADAMTAIGGYIRPQAGQRRSVSS